MPLRDRRRWLVLVILTAWVFLGPVGMAFDACAAMMVVCDGGPCGVVAAGTFAGPLLAPISKMTAMVIPVRDSFPLVFVSALEPPPKSLPLSA